MLSSSFVTEVVQKRNNALTTNVCFGGKNGTSGWEVIGVYNMVNMVICS